MLKSISIDRNITYVSYKSRFLSFYLSRWHGAIFIDQIDQASHGGRTEFQFTFVHMFKSIVFGMVVIKIALRIWSQSSQNSIPASQGTYICTTTSLFKIMNSELNKFQLDKICS